MGYIPAFIAHRREWRTERSSGWGAAGRGSCRDGQAGWAGGRRDAGAWSTARKKYVNRKTEQGAERCRCSYYKNLLATCWLYPITLETLP